MPDLLAFLKLGSPTHVRLLEEVQGNPLIQIGGYYSPGEF